MLVAATLAGALLGGLAGGLVAAIAVRDSGEAPPAPAATPAAASSTPAADAPGSVRFAIDRVLPAIVTVVADLPPRTEGQDVVQTRNIGSGIVVDDAGHVVTNFHVIDGAETLAIVLATGEERPARFIGDDSPFTDLAVLQAPPQGLRSAPLGSSRDVRVGDPVVALGSSAGPGQISVALGIVSAARRALARPGVVLEDLLQTDAAVNHGDSGGALVNLEGRVVGLVTTVLSEGGGVEFDGIAYAQSMDSLRDAIDGIIRTGRSPRPRLGIERFSQHEEVTPALAAQRGLPVPFGALVTAVAPRSPAEAAGVVPGDIVIGVNGVPVDFETPLVNLVKALRPGQRAELLVQRADAQIRIPVSPTME